MKQKIPFLAGYYELIQEQLFYSLTERKVVLSINFPLFYKINNFIFLE